MILDNYVVLLSYKNWVGVLLALAGRGLAATRGISKGGLPSKISRVEVTRSQAVGPDCLEERRRKAVPPYHLKQ